MSQSTAREVRENGIVRNLKYTKNFRVSISCLLKLECLHILRQLFFAFAIKILGSALSQTKFWRSR
ncbi:hypothetical protein DESC_480066 [Desulfosarcina cetonica]|nr:hypothetical protein DESC_480066 [Desulfosarcina cetonica]